MVRVTSTVLGYPRLGRQRELKRATEQYWAGARSADELQSSGATLRRGSWDRLAAAGLDEVPVNDFSFYDHMADLIQLFGVVPQRHRVRAAADGARTDRRTAHFDEYFAMARGTEAAAPLEMTKWFDTNYHYLVPELDIDSTFVLAGDKPVTELREVRDAGVTGRPVLVGPVTFLELAKILPGSTPQFRPLSLLHRLLPVYVQLLRQLASAGAEWVQLDEPILAGDPRPGVLASAEYAFDYLADVVGRPKLLVATYFDSVQGALPMLRRAGVDGVALDFTGSARRNVELLARVGGLPGKRLVAGVVDGRNVWINDLTDSLHLLADLSPLADELTVSTSCSLLHVPVDVEMESELDPQVKPWLAFADQKLAEVTILARALNDGTEAVATEFAANRSALASRPGSPIVNDPAVRKRAAAVTPAQLSRGKGARDRAAVQQVRLQLPLLPTTTIGSFPQTPELRAARAALGKGTLGNDGYDERIAAEIEHVVSLQEQLGLDVLVHGEAERNDMVQYFAEQLSGFAVTRHGWVQSYGTRYVRPPILIGDVSRPRPMTVRWASYAQQLTDRPVKGILTGPVTMLAWSFIRDDQPIETTARQVALALRDEVCDLESAGIAVIQVDEPALRETLPLNRADRPAYLRWAVDAFRLATSGVREDTQIHTHMCYAEFGDILDAIGQLDVDVISLEAARSDMNIASDLALAGYTFAVGPGIYDIHAPRVPQTDEMVRKLRKALDHIPASQLWVNPDCGLKTRTESQATQALRNMVSAAADTRAVLIAKGD